MKRHLVAAALLSSVIFALGAPTTHADDGEIGLTKYVLRADGTYGYDEAVPVQMYSGSAEQVTIPTTYTESKNQFRSSWVATIANLNFAAPDDEADFVAQYDAVLDNFDSWNMNAVIFQVRPLLDAFYPSEINPWSEFVSGTQGQDPGYDPLALMVEATHQRGLEYHAWFNPYRVTNTKISAASVLAAIGLTAAEAAALTVPEHVQALADAGILAPNNVAVQHPDWVLRFDEKLFLNPGLPEVRAHMAATIAEVVENYDIDAVHFDDYFYPYRTTIAGQLAFFGAQGEDRGTFETYGIPAGYADTTAGIEQWRRDNVTALVTDVRTTIDQHNAATGTAVQFGISPFGIWEHQANNPEGSHTPTGSSQSYSLAIFADTRGWVRDELIDYVVPQIYWSFDQGAAPYGELAQWWNNVAEGTRVQVYVGHANYKHVTNGGWEAAWMNPEEIPHQLAFNQKYPNIEGSVFFSYNDLQPTPLDGLAPALVGRNKAKNDSITLLTEGYLSQPALVPAKPWLSPTAVQAPTDVVINETEITWTAPASATRFYIVYAGTGTPEQIASSGERILDRLWAGSGTAFPLPVTPATDVDYVVTAVDAAGVESAPILAEYAEAPPTEAPPTVPPTQEPTVAPKVDPVTQDPTAPSTQAPGAGGTQSSPGAAGTGLAATGSSVVPTLLGMFGLGLAGMVGLVLRRRWIARS